MRSHRFLQPYRDATESPRSDEGDHTRGQLIEGLLLGAGLTLRHTTRDSSRYSLVPVMSPCVLTIAGLLLQGKGELIQDFYDSVLPARV